MSSNGSKSAQVRAQLDHPIIDAGQKAQEIMANQALGEPLDVKYQVDPGLRKQQVVSHEKWGERTTELVQPYNRLIMRHAK